MISLAHSTRAGLRLTSAAVLLATGGLLGLAPAGVQAQVKGKLTVLHNFEGTGGNGPIYGLIKGTDGYLYGVSPDGGNNDAGFVYRLSTSGTFTVLHAFTNDFETDVFEGNSPRAIIQGADGNLYGICRGGGAEPRSSGGGTFFKLTLSGVFTKLYDFETTNSKDGTFPSALVQAKDGKFYGATRIGGKTGLDDGTVFRITTNGTAAGTTRTELYAFSTGNNLGYTPEAQFLLASDGNIYGMTENGGGSGGAAAFGAIFKVTTAGSVTSVHAFLGEGAPANHTYPLIQGKDGYLYGTSANGGGADYGTVFRCTTAGGNFALLHDFDDPQTDGAEPRGQLYQAVDGNFYGPITAAFASDPADLNLGPGGYFKLTPSGAYSVIYKFTEVSGAPSSPFGNLTETSAGHFFGVTGGGTNSDGTIISLLLSPTIISPSTATATVNQSFSYQIKTYGLATAYASSTPPAGLSFDKTKGLLSGKPTGVGTHSVTLLAGNTAGSGSLVLTITVKAAAPVITSAGSATGKVGTAFSYQITATNSPTSYGASGLPAGLSISTSTGKISGTPTKAGSYNVTIAAFNSGGHGSKTLALKIN